MLPSWPNTASPANKNMPSGSINGSTAPYPSTYPHHRYVAHFSSNHATNNNTIDSLHLHHSHPAQLFDSSKQLPLSQQQMHVYPFHHVDHHRNASLQYQHATSLSSSGVLSPHCLQRDNTSENLGLYSTSHQNMALNMPPFLGTGRVITARMGDGISSLRGLSSSQPLSLQRGRGGGGYDRAMVPTNNSNDISNDNSNNSGPPLSHWGEVDSLSSYNGGSGRNFAPLNLSPCPSLTTGRQQRRNTRFLDSTAAAAATTTINASTAIGGGNNRYKESVSSSLSLFDGQKYGSGKTKSVDVINALSSGSAVTVGRHRRRGPQKMEQPQRTQLLSEQMVHYENHQSCGTGGGGAHPEGQQQEGGVISTQPSHFEGSSLISNSHRDNTTEILPETMETLMRSKKLGGGSKRRHFSSSNNTKTKTTFRSSTFAADSPPLDHRLPGTKGSITMISGNNYSYNGLWRQQEALLQLPPSSRNLLEQQYSTTSQLSSVPTFTNGGGVKRAFQNFLREDRTSLPMTKVPPASEEMIDRAGKGGRSSYLSSPSKSNNNHNHHLPSSPISSGSGSGSGSGIGIGIGIGIGSGIESEIFTSREVNEKKKSLFEKW